MNNDDEWWNRLDYMIAFELNNECNSVSNVDDDSLVSDFNYYLNIHSSTLSSMPLSQTSAYSSPDLRPTVSANPNTPSQSAVSFVSDSMGVTLLATKNKSSSALNGASLFPNRCSSAASIASNISDASTSTHFTYATSVSKTPSFESFSFLNSSPNLIKEISANRRIRSIFNTERKKGRKIIKVPLLVSSQMKQMDSSFGSFSFSTEPFFSHFEREIVFIGRPSDWPEGLAKEYLSHIRDGKYELAVITFKPKSAGEYESLMRYASDADEINHQDVEFSMKNRSINKRLRELEKKKKSTRKAAGGDEINLFSVAATNIGQRKKMEDRYTLFTEDGQMKWMFAAVYDGHNGIEAVDSAKVSVFKKFREFHSKRNGAAIAESLRCSLSLTESKIISDSKENDWESGSTAICAVVMDKNLVIASIGDCRAVMCKKGVAHDLTRDHRFSNDEYGNKERLRAENEGGSIDPDGYLGDAVNVSRALGDYSVKDERKLIGLTADPDIIEYTLSQDDEFLLLGCDGIFEKLTSQEAIDCVFNTMKDTNGDISEAAYNLIGQALSYDVEDNLTCIILSFHSYHTGSGTYWRNPQSLKASASTSSLSSSSRKRYDFSQLGKFTQT